MEMTIEQKAKAYDEALERAKELLEVGLKDTRDKRVVLSFFPELVESEDGIKDERIRKAVISTFKSHCSFYEVSVDEVLAWFEKRFSKSRRKEIDDAYLRGISDAKQELGKQVEKAKYHDVCNECVRQPICQSDCFLQQEEQKPSDWSEEDEDIKDSIIHQLKMLRGDRNVTEGNKKEIDWLKSLRPQAHWKPSEGQMKALNTCIMQGEISYVGQGTELQSLYNDLKKLAE